LAFPSAGVEANWGTTGAVHCVTDERIYDDIMEKKKSNKLSKKDIDALSHAFRALTRCKSSLQLFERCHGILVHVLGTAWQWVTRFG